MMLEDTIYFLIDMRTRYNHDEWREKLDIISYGGFIKYPGAMFSNLIEWEVSTEMRKYFLNQRQRGFDWP